MTRTRGLLFALLFAATIFFAGAVCSPAQSSQQAPKPAPLHLTNSSIQILQIQSDEVKLPPEFQLAMYENLIDQVTKTGRFQHVYRDGDKNAASATDLVTLSSTVTGFKKGSAQERQVLTVAGKTSIKVHLVLTDKSGKSLLDTNVEGKVQFLGENLRATFNFSKKVAKVIKENFVAPATSHT